MADLELEGIALDLKDIKNKKIIPKCCVCGSVLFENDLLSKEQFEIIEKRLNGSIIFSHGLLSYECVKNFYCEEDADYLEEGLRYWSCKDKTPNPNYKE